MREPRLSTLGTGTERLQLPSQTRQIGDTFTPFYARDGVLEITRFTLGREFGAVAVGKTPNTTVQYFARNHPNGRGHKLASNANMNFRSRAEKEGNAGKCTERA